MSYNFYTSSETQNCNSNPIHVPQNNKTCIEYRPSTYQTTLFALSVIKLSQCVPIDYVCCHCFPPPPRSQRPLPFSKCFPPGQLLLPSFSSYPYLWFETSFVSYHLNHRWRRMHPKRPPCLHVVNNLFIYATCIVSAIGKRLGRGVRSGRERGGLG